jgi:hypothetical protein
MGSSGDESNLLGRLPKGGGPNVNRKERVMDRIRMDRIKRLSNGNGRSCGVGQPAAFVGLTQPRRISTRFAKRIRSRVPVGAFSPQPGGRQVNFEFFDPRAASVSVAGAFNACGLQVIPLRKRGAGEWGLRMVLEPGRYEYHFLADGQRRPDPTATQQVTNLCGGLDSVLVVE